MPCLSKLFPVSTLLLAAASQVLGQVFEPADFNATQALLDLGFDPAAVPPVVSEDVERAVGWNCRAACTSLRIAFGDDAALTSNEPEYDSFTGAYWSEQQGDVNPACIFKPSSAVSVSSAVLISRLTQCPFAAKSGGHAAFAGASNIEGGITISFEKMNKVQVSADKKSAAIQPGNTWGGVFTKLADYEVTAVGGRVYGVGTGGLTLGGGISFFSGLYGWACDNISKYTVVTASGIIVEATPTKFSDLYWALRGGGNNFGLVVEFEANLFPLPKNEIWGGSRVYTEDSFPAVMDAFYKVITEAPEDPKAGQWVAYLAQPRIASTEFWYTEPVEDPAIFSGYDGLPSVADSTKIRPLPEYSASLQGDNPNGFRQIYHATTVKFDRELLGRAKEIYYEEFATVSHVAGIFPTLIDQGITLPMMQHMSKNGGNPLGLDASQGPFFLMHMACWWDNEEDDVTVEGFVQRVIRRIDEEAKAKGLDYPYIYMNYASRFQDVIAGYGSENVQKLKKIAKKYDPAQVFQKLQPGHFKFDHAPIEA